MKRKVQIFAFLLLGMLAIGLHNVAVAQATLLSQFDFNGNLDDQLGNGTATLYNNISTSYSGSSLNWLGDTTTNGGGLVVRIPDLFFTESNYSIAIDLSYSEVAGYRKIVDFRGLSIDAGAYVSSVLRLYSSGNFGTTYIPTDTNFTVLITREAANDSTKFYVVKGNSLFLESVAVDAADEYVAHLAGLNRELHFFHDDSVTTDEFSPSGTVNQIRIWNGIADLGDVVTATQPATQSIMGVYPNPTQDLVHLQFKTPQSGTLEVLDAMGRRVSSTTLRSASSQSIDLSAQPAGIYFLRLGAQSTRIVKQ